MSASLNKKYLRMVEERDAALRQVRELQAQLSGVQSQLDAANARDAEARKLATATVIKINELTTDLVNAQTREIEYRAQLDAIEARRKAGQAEREARRQALQKPE